MCIWNFAFGEYSHTLRLTSELVDLRVANANPYLLRLWLRRVGSRAERVSKIKRTLTRSVLFILVTRTGLEPMFSP